MSNVDILEFQGVTNTKTKQVVPAPVTAAPVAVVFLAAAALKVLSSHSNWGVRLDSFDPMLKSRCPAIFTNFF